MYKAAVIIMYIQFTVMHKINTAVIIMYEQFIVMHKINTNNVHL